MNRKKVFISYSHDSDQHREKVLALSERLRADGIETLLDQYVNGSPPEGWPRWMLDQLDAVDFVLVICSETYYRRFRGHEQPGKGKGVDWEGALITQELYDSRSRTLKFVPVFLANAVEEWVPEPLRSRNHYALISESAYNNLYDFLQAQAGVEPGELGTPKPKPRRKGTPLTFDATPRPPDVSAASRTVLVIGASPLGMPRLNIPEEIRQITAGLDAAPLAGPFKLVAENDVRRKDFVALLEKHQPEILHFTGYQSDTGGIRLVDEAGQPSSVERDALVHFFKTRVQRPSLFFLNTCHSWELAQNLGKLIDYVIAYKAETTDEIATRLAGAFYRALAAGLQVPAALDRAKSELGLEGVAEDLLPALADASNRGVPEPKPRTADPAGPRLVPPALSDDVRRQQAQSLKDMLAKFEATSGVLNARTMLDDHNVRPVELFLSGSARPGKRVNVTVEMVCTALAEEDADDDPQEPIYNAIRDCFDAYFDGLEQFDLDLSDGLLNEQQVEKRLGYWIQQFSDEKVSKKGVEFVRAARHYVEQYYPGEVQSLCARFGKGFPPGNLPRSQTLPVSAGQEPTAAGPTPASPADCQAAKALPTKKPTQPPTAQVPLTQWQPAGVGRPRVYISYTWREKLGAERALNLADQLREAGIDARIDLYYRRGRHGFTAPPLLQRGEDAWTRWQQEQIRDADRVIVICGPEYANSPAESGVGRDLRFMEEDLERPGVELRKFLPVGFDHYVNNKQNIPPFLQGANYYNLGRGSKTGGLKDLIRHFGNEFPGGVAQAHRTAPAAAVAAVTPPRLPQQDNSSVTGSNSEQTVNLPSVASELQSSDSHEAIVWLHLSDFHFCKPKTGWDSHRVIGPLKDDLQQMEATFGLTPQMIFFTGDAAFGQLGSAKGESLEEQFDDAQALLDKIRTCFRSEVPLENLFLVPGNHDVDRHEAMPEQTEWLDRQKDAQVITGLIHAGAKQWQRYMERLAAYRAFLERRGYHHLLTDPRRLIYSATRQLAGRRVGIAGLNSAWSCCRDTEKGRLWLGGDWQMGELTRQLGETEFAIALMHHPLGWFVEYEDPQLRAELEREFRFFLHGHEHQGWVEQHGDGHVRIAGAAGYEGSRSENGYNLVRLDLQTGEAAVWLRRYDVQGGGWVPRIIARKTDNNGCWPLGRPNWLQKLVQPKPNP